MKVLPKVLAAAALACVASAVVFLYSISPRLSGSRILPPGHQEVSAGPVVLVYGPFGEDGRSRVVEVVYANGRVLPSDGGQVYVSLAGRCPFLKSPGLEPGRPVVVFADGDVSVAARSQNTKMA
jgi:hypothetical protein